MILNEMLNPLQIELDYNLPGWKYIVDIQTNEYLSDADITYEIYEVWKLKGGKQRIELKNCTHPLYRDKEIEEMVFDRVHQYFYEKECERKLEDLR